MNRRSAMSLSAAEPTAATISRSRTTSHSFSPVAIRWSKSTRRTEKTSNLSASTMTPRRFLNFFRSPTGALTLFLLGLLVVLILVNSRRPAQQRVSLIPQKLLSKKDNAPQLPETIRREMVPFDPKTADQKQPSPAPSRETGSRAADAGAHRCRGNAASRDKRG